MSLTSLVILPVSIIAFAILLMLIVFIHEYGHFGMARLLGIRVDVFSIGFGKPLARFTDRAGTEWRIAMIPLGGYVKFFGDANAASQPSAATHDDEGQDAGSGASPATTQFETADRDDLASRMTPEERAECFHFKPVWARSLVVAAGPFANFILATAIFAGLLMIFGRTIIAPVIGTVIEDSAAVEAGLMPGDRIVSIEGRPVKGWTQIQQYVQLSSDEDLAFVVDRNGESVSLTVTPRRTETEDAFGNKTRMGIVGISPDIEQVESRRYGPIGAIGAGAQDVWRVITTTVRFVGRLVRGKESAEQLGGPIKMAKYAGQAASSGFSDRVREDATFGERLTFSLTNWVQLAGFISVSIGFLNLLPVPVLDGGHLVYYAIEAATGRPLGPRVQAVGYQVGFLILISFMVFVTWNDITGLISSVFTRAG